MWRKNLTKVQEMKKLKKITAMSLAAILVSASASFAASIDIPDNSSPYEVNFIETWDTTGNDMDGMEITVVDSSGASSTAVWADNAGAQGTGWSLTLDYYEKTTWHNSGVPRPGAFWSFKVEEDFEAKQLTINALPGATVFDVIYDPYTTPNSVYGWKMNWEDLNDKPGYASYDSNGDPVGPQDTIDRTTTYTDFLAKYSNPVFLTNASPLYDLYGTLTIDFNVDSPLLKNYFTSDSTLFFGADTDNINPVPEPTTLLLFGTGLIGLATMRQRKRKNS